MPTSSVAPADILAFWRDAGPDRWYRPDPAFDAEVRRRFLDVWKQAAAGELAAWEESDDGRLALVIVLDQFPRNMFRGDAQTYASDARAREVAGRAIDAGADRRIDPALRDLVEVFGHQRRSCQRERPSFLPGRQPRRVDHAAQQ